MLLYVTASFVTILTTVFIYSKWVYNYWKRLGVPFLEPTFPFGNLKDLFAQKISLGEQSQKNYRIAKSKGYKHLGLFGFFQPMYVPIDEEILKGILVKDFNHFIDRGVYQNEKDDPISGNLFMLEGDRWKYIRAKLTPTFTSGKIKMMFNIVLECSEHFKKALDTRCESGPINAKQFLQFYGVDVIGSCAFGLNCNSFADSNSSFCRYSKKVFEPSGYENLKLAFTFFFPTISKFLKMKVVPSDISEFYLSTMRNAVEYRKTNKVVRNDFLQVLINLMEEDSGLTVEEVGAQAFIFFLAGFETFSTVMMYCLFELAVNQDIQETLRQEVNEVMERNQQVMTYDNVKKMLFMNQVLDETMRKYPPLPELHRKCTSDYKVPTTNVILKKGTQVSIPLLGIQTDPDYFLEPEKFNPDRFSLSNRDKIRQFSWMPFGEGPRVCIGLRFAYLQMKISLAMILKNYKLTLNEKTQMPLKMNPKSFIISPIGSIWLNFEKLL